MDDHYVSIEQAAKQLGVTGSRVHQMVKDGQVPTYPFNGKSYAINLSVLVQYHQKKREYQKGRTPKNQQYQRYQTDLVYRLRINLRSRLNASIKANCKIGSAVRDLGCTIPEFVQYIAGLFKEGMSWDNWGEWHLDHIRPLASFDLTDREQFLAACHYMNIQPLWAGENRRKGTKLI